MAIFLPLLINIKSYTKYRKKEKVTQTDKIKHSIDVATAEMTSIYV